MFFPSCIDFFQEVLPLTFLLPVPEHHVIFIDLCVKNLFLLKKAIIFVSMLNKYKELQVCLAMFQLFWLKSEWDFVIKAEKLYLFHSELAEKAEFWKCDICGNPGFALTIKRAQF